MISRKHKALFVHIPKCAGQSIENVFLVENGLTWETRSPLLLMKNDNPAVGPPRLAHLTLDEYLKFGYLSDSDLLTYFKFTVVRNPWERTVSLYRHLKKKSSFRSFLKNWLRPVLCDKNVKYYWFVKPQVEFFKAKGEFQLDSILRFENLGLDFQVVSDRLNLHTPLGHQNSFENNSTDKRSNLRTTFFDFSIKKIMHQEYLESKKWYFFYGKEEIDLVGEIYRQDIETLGYQFKRDSENK